MILLALLLLAAPAALALRAAGRPAAWAALGAGVVAGFGFALVAIASLLSGTAAVPLVLPFRLGGLGTSLVLDGLSAWFLLILGVASAASCLWALPGEVAAPARRSVPVPPFIAGMAITLLAGDGATLLLGFGMMSLASWALVATDHEAPANREAARLYLAFAAFAGTCLLAALALLARGGGLDFAALRAAPPEGWRAGAFLALSLAGCGAKAGLVPLHPWLPLAHPAAPSHVSALMSAAMTKVALYVLARLVLDLAGPAQPLWWGAPLVALGAASAVLGALRAATETDAKTLLACSTIEHVGLVAMGLGLAAVFRAADLGTLSALAAGGALLHALNHAVFKTLLFLGIGGVVQAAGSRSLDRLGGLIHAMPATAALCLIGAAAAAALPPLSGFASEWLILQSLLAAWRVGEIGLQLGAAATAALFGLAVALAAAAMLRLFGVVFLGRPRHPRTLGAREGARLATLVLVALAGLTLVLGLLPGPMLDLAAPALRVATRHVADRPAGFVTLRAGEASFYLPLVVAALLAGLSVLIAWAVRRASPAGVARAPAWDNGFMAPPPHLPFGEPLAQPSAAGLAQPIERVLGGAVLGAREVVEAAPPGDPRPARLFATARDPAFSLLLAPLGAVRDVAAAWAERLRGLSAHGGLALSFGVLLALLALVAWLERA
ncbi:proton-conducting transporter membrane subunit [Muricoccus radiodurans]|uniref:proton-conducting transporter transmembrane domain-containing protein n=1 Tax=Muricoccus radiodurans TaxID=2231721 RepID=UPI003CEA875B